jgi:hypothetical protein
VLGLDVDARSRARPGRSAPRRTRCSSRASATTRRR